MILEKSLEDKIIVALEAMLDTDEVQIVGSRRTTNYEEHEILEDEDKPTVIAVGTGFRQHDTFSVSPITVAVNIQIATRIELDPSAEKHEAIIEKIANKLSHWHFYGEEMCDALSSDKFLVSELRMDGGSGRLLDRGTGIWSENITISCRGTENVTI